MNSQPSGLGRLLSCVLLLTGALASGGCVSGAGGDGNTGAGGAPDTGSGGKPAGGGGATGQGGATGGGGATGQGGATGGGGATGAGGNTNPGTGGRITGAGGAAVGAGGRTGTGGATGAGGVMFVGTQPSCVFPTAVGADVRVASTINVTGAMDGGMRRYVSNGLGDGSQTEGQDPIFMLANNATLSNVIIGAPAADGVHCTGTCTLRNVFWEDVGEDAASMLATSASAIMTVTGGGARHAADKVFQHNGAGTVAISNFCVDDFSKFYRSCGNCDSQPTRHVTLSNIDVRPSANSEAMVGVNANYNDTAVIHGIFMHLVGKLPSICDRYTGNTSGAEPVRLVPSGPFPPVCVFNTAMDVAYIP